MEDSELLAEREVLYDRVGPAGEDCEESPGGGRSAVEHPRTMTAVGTEGNQARPQAIRVSCTGAQLVEGQGGPGVGEGQRAAPDRAHGRPTRLRGSSAPAARYRAGRDLAALPSRASTEDAQLRRYALRWLSRLGANHQASDTSGSGRRRDRFRPVDTHPLARRVVVDLEQLGDAAVWFLLVAAGQVPD